MHYEQVNDSIQCSGGGFFRTDDVEYCSQNDVYVRIQRYRNMSLSYREIVVAEDQADLHRRSLRS